MKPKKQAKRKLTRKPVTASAIAPVDKEAVEELVAIAKAASTDRRGARALWEQRVLAPAKRPAPVASAKEREAQLLRSFFEDIDFDQLESDVETMQEIQVLTSRRGDDETSATVDRVVKLLEILLDTGETCGLKPSN